MRELAEARNASEGGWIGTGPDGMLYFTTSNRDGRGRVREGDDKVLRIDPALRARAGSEPSQ
jgi:hypothetical protein